MYINRKHLLHYYTSDEFYDRITANTSTFEPKAHALVYLDFDNFNFINDLFGYKTGDMTLSKIEEHFSNELNDGEFFSRIHADHFVFWVKVTKKISLIKRFLKLTDVKQTLKDILPPHYNLVCSGGIIFVNNTFDNLSSLLDKANFARKQAKGNHISNFLYYNKELTEELEWEKKITLSMDQALKDREFEMYLQPKFLIKTNELVGAEALVRWNSKKYGLIYPDKFIPVFEQNGFIKHLDFFMLEEACIFIRNLINMGYTPIPISVNFSKVHIGTKNFVKKVFRTLNTYGVPTKLIEIEFTESIFSHNLNSLVTTLNSLKELGFTVSLDDFGRAYSSLNCLKDLPIDVVKIDKDFLNSSSNTDKGRIIITKVIEMIRALKLISVMEGIETKEQECFLNSLNCDLGQGYLYAKPMPTSQYMKFLKENLYINNKIIALSHADELEQNELIKNSLENNMAELKALIKYERKRHEILRLREEKYRLIIDQIDDVIFEWDFPTDSITFSYKLERIFGEESIQHNFKTNSLIKSRIHPDDIYIFEEWIESIYKHLTTSQVEFRCKSSNNNYTWFRSKATTILNNLGKPIKAVCVFTDITKQKTEIATLVRKAELDPLTQIYNKAETKRHIEDYIASLGRIGGD